ncbi:hypothetical protein IAR55_000466 [Kwoniella newhampshirensis]|uniref:Dynactin subunit 6 n=1 Tax=Kwoniella newhampshirensis TaxID=1651941 RepID=A0AAW0Z6P4_9TREE
MSRSAAPPTRIAADSTSLICQDTDLRGDITIGPGVVVHPKVTILALGGPIVIGAECIVEELVVIVNRGKNTMKIGQGNHFMVASQIESPSIGHFNTFQPRCKASSGVIVTDHCTLSAGTILLPLLLPTTSPEPSLIPEILPPYSVIFGSASDRRIWDGSGESAEQALRGKHVEYLREVIPK